MPGLRDPSVHSFAQAVARQLAWPDRHEGNTSGEHGIAEILDAALDLAGDFPVRALYESPELLASFFQNADLLDPDSPAAARVLHLIMAAVELAWADGE